LPRFLGALDKSGSAGTWSENKYEDLDKGFIKTDAWIDLLYAEVSQTPDAAGYQNHGHADERK